LADLDLCWAQSEDLVSIDTEVHQIEYNSRRSRGAGLYQRQSQNGCRSSLCEWRSGEVRTYRN